ncbi:MAG TPA: hypothetical protein VJ572_01450 [Azonexus sp.]|nr:hypothetical protein [Azonexus sp.]
MMQKNRARRSGPIAFLRCQLLLDQQFSAALAAKNRILQSYMNIGLRLIFVLLKQKQ